MIDSGRVPRRELDQIAALLNIRTLTGERAKKASLVPGVCKPERLLGTLKNRFDDQREYHPRTSWDQVEEALSMNDLRVIWAMEKSGGQPDLVLDGKDTFVFADTCPATASVRRNMYYDAQAQEEGGRINPGGHGNAMTIVDAWGAQLWDPAFCETMQEMGKFEVDRSFIWLRTPDRLRRSGRVFRAHMNGISDGDYSANNHRDDWGFRARYDVSKKADQVTAETPLRSLISRVWSTYLQE